MTEYFREFRPPAPPVVKLRCSLHATHLPPNPNDPGAWSGEPKPDDIRGWLDAQTAEYRDEALLPFRGPGVEAWKNLCDEYANERDSLKSQLSAAIAEKNTLTQSVSVLNKEVSYRHERLTSARETIRTLEMNEQNHVRSLHGMQADIERLRDEGAAAEKERDAARETIRKLEAQLAEGVDLYDHSVRERASIGKALNDTQESIRALTEDTDARDRATWERAQRASGDEAFRRLGGNVSRAERIADCMTPYEPPRSEEGRTACRGCGKPLLFENRHTVADGCPCNSARGVNHGLVPTDTCTCVKCDPAQTGSVRREPTRLAPLTDSDCVGCGDDTSACRGDGCAFCCWCKRELIPVDLPKTPDVRREGFAAARPCTLCHGTGKRRVNHDRGEGQSVTYEDCSCGGAPPSIPPVLVLRAEVTPANPVHVRDALAGESVGQQCAAQAEEEDPHRDQEPKVMPTKRKPRRKPATLRDLVMFFHREGFDVEIVARPFAVVAKAKRTGTRNARGK